MYYNVAGCCGSRNVGNKNNKILFALMSSFPLKESPCISHIQRLYAETVHYNI